MKVNYLLIAFILFVCTWFEAKVQFFVLLLCLIVLRKKLNKFDLVFVVAIYCTSLILNNKVVFNENVIQGKVIEISQKSFVVKVNEGNIRIISDNTPLLDSVLLIKGDLINNKDSSHFYLINFEKINNQKNIIATIVSNDIKLIKESNSIRSLIHKRINTLKYEDRFIYLALCLLQKTTSNMWFLQCGFHMIWLVKGILYLFSFVFNKKQNKIIEILLYIFLGILFHFPFFVLRKLGLTIFDQLKINTIESYAIITILCFIFNSSLLSSLSYLIPTGLVFLQSKSKKHRFLFIMMIQSYFLYSVNFFELIFFTLIQKLTALLTVFAYLDLIMDTSLVEIGVSFLSKFEINQFVAYGKCPELLFIICLIQLFYIKNDRILILLNILISIILVFQLSSPFAEVSFINVDQGDCILIRLPLNQANILIDTGKKNQYESLKSFLKAKGIKKLDLLILTHDDEDHSGSKDLLLQDFEVNKIINELTQTITIKDLTFNIIQYEQFQTANDRILIVMFNLNKINYLFLADISSEVEFQLINDFDVGQFDLIKIAHHGSNTATSTKLLESVKPILVVNSSGLNNSYHHPHPDVLKRLNDLQIPLLDTQIQGDITITSTTFFNFINTSNRQFGIIKWVVK